MNADLLTASPVPCYVGGQAYTGSGSYDVKDPHNPSQTLHSVSSVTLDDVPAVIAAAEKAFPAWKAVSLAWGRLVREGETVDALFRPADFGAGEAPDLPQGGCSVEGEDWNSVCCD
jgi:hypothetical protein